MINNSSEYTNEIDMNWKNNSLTKILERIPKKSNVLEFGPAGGYMTKYLKEKLECKITCVEISEELAIKAKPFAEKMIIEDIDRIDFQKTFPKAEEFDIIIFSDVLEHLYNPWKTLKECNRLLKKTGKILTSIPNVAHISIILSLIKGEFEYLPAGLLDNTHIRFFTKKSIIELFETNGYYIEEFDFVRADFQSSEIVQTKFEFDSSIISKLKENPDHNIYQYITVAGKTNENFSIRIEELKKELKLNKDEYNHLERLNIQSEERYAQVVNSSSYKILISFAQILNSILKFFRLR